MNFRNLTTEPTERLIEERDYLSSMLTGVFAGFSWGKMSPSRKRTAQWELEQVKYELRKPYRRN